MPVVELADFTGGRDTRRAINLVDINKTPDQNNCWAPNGALVKRNGSAGATISFANGAETAITAIPTQIFPSNLGTNGIQRLLIIGSISAFTTTIRALLSTQNGTTFTPEGLKTGTVAVTTTTVTGSGTLWNTAGASKVQAGDLFRVDSDGAFRQIQSVDSDTQLTLAASYPSNYGAGKAYTIMKRFVTGNPVSCAVLNATAYIGDGTNPTQRFDGTDVRDVSAFPVCKHLKVFKNHVFAWGPSGNRSRLQWCAVNDATTWPATNYQDIYPNDFDGSRGMAVFRDSLILFKNRSMYIFQGQSPFDPTNPTYSITPLVVPPDFTFYASRSICVHQGVLKFLTEKGWYGYQGGTELREMISYDIQTDVDAFRRLGTAEEAMVDSPCAYVYNDDMLVAVVDTGQSPTTTLNSIWVQDRFGAWWRWFPSGANAFYRSDFASIQFDTQARKLIAGNVGQNDLQTMDTTSSDSTAGGGNAINGYWVSREQAFQVSQEIIYIKVWFKKQSAGNLTVSYSIDRATFVDATVDMTTGAGTIVEATIPVQAMAKTIRIKLSNATLAQTFEVYKVAIVTQDTEADQE